MCGAPRLGTFSSFEAKAVNVGRNTYLATDLGGDQAALEELTPLVYQQLRQIAQRQVSSQPDAWRWEATGLVHDVYIRLIGEAAITWKDRVHFFATVATAMRRVLVDKARELKSLKRGGQQQQADLTLSWFGQDDPGFDLIDLNDALERLKELSPRQARLVELRFFGGLTEDDAAEVLGVSRRTAAGDWAMAKAWLYRELNRE